MFVCKGFGECTMAFSRSEHLARHIRKHTGERPFVCHCDRGFSRLDNLRQHANTVHADTPDRNAETIAKLQAIHSSLAVPSKPSRSRSMLNHCDDTSTESPGMSPRHQKGKRSALSISLPPTPYDMSSSAPHSLSTSPSFPYTPNFFTFSPQNTPPMSPSIPSVLVQPSYFDYNAEPSPILGSPIDRSEQREFSFNAEEHIQHALRHQQLSRFLFNPQLNFYPQRQQSYILPV